tara:strand:- start:254 stop:775 length:522 start_codon:yes stop_codon:yes gene_type:complete
MSKLDNLETYLTNWIDQLDAKIDHPFINNQSLQHCPYAKASYTNNRTKTVKVTDYTLDNFWRTVSQELIDFNPDEKDIVFVAAETDTSIINGMQLSGGVDSINTLLNVQKQDKWLLSQFGDDYTMVFIQKITDLDNGSKILEKKGYYNGLHPYSFNKNVIRRRRMRNRLDNSK